jgi:hypothetical protein
MKRASIGQVIFGSLQTGTRTTPQLGKVLINLSGKRCSPGYHTDEDRFEQIRNEAARMAKSVMEDYLCQWKRYLNSDKWAGEAEMAKYAAKNFHPKLTVSFGGQLFSPFNPGT